MSTLTRVTSIRAARSRIPLRSAMALLFALPLLLLASCAKGPAPKLYMLDLPFGAQMAGIAKGVSVGVGPLEFPQYLDRPQIITRTGVNRLHASDEHVWAEPIKNSASRVLVVTLAEQLGSNRIYLVPRRVRTPLDWKVEIDVGRFDSTIGGEAVLAVRWSLYRGDDKDAALTRVSIVTEALAGEDYAALVSAQTLTLVRLGREIAAAIKAG